MSRPSARRPAAAAADEEPAAAPVAGAVVVYRYHVPPALGPAFVAACARLVDGPEERRVVLPAGGTLVALQPVLGTDPDVWELRLEVPDVAAFGALVDGSADSVVLLQDRVVELAHVGKETDEVVRRLDVPNPVVRVVGRWTGPEPSGTASDG